MTVSATQTLADEVELLVAEAARAQVSIDAAVATLQFGEHAEHRLGRSRENAGDPFALGFRSGLGEPHLVPRPKPLLAERVVVSDLRVIDAGYAKQQPDEQARPVLASHAMDDDTAVRCVRDSGKCCGD